MFFCGGTAPQSTLVNDPSCTPLQIQIHSHQAIFCLIPTELIFPYWVWLLKEYFSLTPLLYFHYQVCHLHYLLQINLYPYIPLRRLHTQLNSLPISKRPDSVDLTYQDCMATLLYTRLVGNPACYPSPRLTTTCFFPTCIIPTDIKLVMLCEKNWRFE